MMQAIEFKGVRQRSNHVILADDFAKLAGTPFPGKCLISHVAWEKSVKNGAWRLNP